MFVSSYTFTNINSILDGYITKLKDLQFESKLKENPIEMNLKIIIIIMHVHLEAIGNFEEYTFRFLHVNTALHIDSAEEEKCYKGQNMHLKISALQSLMNIQ